MYRIELMWNRSFNWENWGKPTEDLAKAKSIVDSLVNMGDGASVKKARVVEEETEKVIYNR